MKMGKFSAGKASVLALTAVAVLASFLLGKSITSVHASDDKDRDHGDTGGWSACVSTGPQCGTDNGHKSKTVTQDANHTHICPTDYSDAGYDHDHWDKECRKELTTGNWESWQGGDSSETTNIEFRHKDTHGSGWESGKGNSPHELEHRHFVPNYDYEDKVKQYSCPTDWTAKSGDETKCEKIETLDCQTGQIDDSACTTPDNGDICHNIDGIQYAIPEGMHMDAEGANCVNFSGSGPAPRNDEGVGGAVLGASTGQVLGASTMAGTGAFDETLYSAIMSIGATLSAFGLKGLKKAKKISKK
jgi:hypothetical protein